MKTIFLSLFFPIAIVFVTVCASCQQTEKTKSTVQTDEEGAQILQTLNDEYAEAWENGETEKCLSMMTPDYVNYLTYGNTQNRKAVEEMFYAIAQNNKLSNVKFTRTELFIHEDMAYEFGYLTQDITPNDTGETRTAKNRHISVFKKVDGKWLYHRWMPQPEIN